MQRAGTKIEKPSQANVNVSMARLDRVILIAFIVTVAAVPLAFLYDDYARPSAVKWFIIGTVPPALLVYWICHRQFAGQLALRWSLITPFAIAILFTQGVSLINATNPHLTLIHMSRSLGLLAAYFLAANIVSTSAGMDRLLWGIAAGGAVAALYGIAQSLGWDFVPWQVTPGIPIRRGVSTFGNPNFAAHFLVSAIPLASVLAMTRENLAARVAACLVTAVLFYHLLLTGARGSTIGLAVGAALVLFLLVRHHARQPSGTENRGDRTAVRWWMALAVLLIFVLGSPAAVRAWREKGGEESVSRRLTAWQTATRLFFRHPAIGIGAGNFEVVSPSIWQEMEVERFVKFHKMSYEVHNEYIETAAEQGVIGLVVLVCLLTSAVIEAFGIATSAPSGKQRSYGYAMLAAVVAQSVDACFNFGLQMPASALLFWVVLGMITCNVTSMRATSLTVGAGKT